MTLLQLLTSSSGLQEMPDSDAGLRGELRCGSVSRFVLNRRGGVFHLVGCDSVGKAQPWAWAEPLTNSQIRRWIEPLGIRPCRRCNPLEAGRS
jgi:hypothetical protein